MKTGGLLVFGLLAAALAAAPARALETDQFYAWTRPLEDASAAINERINAEIDGVLARVNAQHRAKACSCRIAEYAIRDHFNYAIIAKPEMWVSKTSSIQRIPATPEEEPRFRRAYLYGGSPSFAPVRLMPPSATIEVAGIRLGTDKIGHFFSDGAWAELTYRIALKEGATDAEAQRKALQFSIATESTIWGKGSSGILSLADLEANYQGFTFYRGLCGGPDPELASTPSGWRMKRPFDLRLYVTPEWDESWQPNIDTRGRWAKVRPIMQRHCAELDDPAVRRRWAEYAARDRETATEAEISKLVAAGKLDDPAPFTIEAVCGLGPGRRLTPPAAPAESGR